MSAVRPLYTRISLPRLLSVTPSSALVDTKVAIRATGVEANSHVTIRCTCEQDTRGGRLRFEGHAHYIADDRGVVSVPDQTSWGGTYTGTEPMGLFWSMHPASGQRFGSMYRVEDVTKPMVVNLSLHRGHLDTDTLQTAEPEASTTAERWYLGKDVERIKVHSGRLRGTVFKPRGPGPFPGVVDMFGSSGGLIEMRAAMLASRGLACYALPYFKYEDLPTDMWELELEYFRDAVGWMSDRPFVQPGGVGMVGASIGAGNAMATVSHFPEKVKAVVSISGCHAQNSFPLTLGGERLPFIKYDAERLKPSMRVEGAKEMLECYQEVHDIGEEDGTIHKLEKAGDCPFLFIVGQDDRLWDSYYYAQEATKRLARHGCHNYQLLSYPNAGHLIEVPYAPACSVAFTSFAGCVVDIGGSTVGNAKAMEDSWPKIVRFLHAHCGHGNSKL